MSPSDAELMERFGTGDDDAFRELVQRHQKPLLNFFWRRCFDRTLAEDCVQEVFLRLVRHRGRWRPQAKFTTYLYGIALNHWIDRYRSRKAGPTMTSLNTQITAEGKELVHAVPGSGPEPGDAAAASELGGRIAGALRQLSEEQRSVFLLAETRGLKYADIASLLGIPIGTVKSRMHAAMTRLRGLLKDELREPLS